MRNDLVVQLKMVRCISRPLLIQIVIAQHVMLQINPMYRMHALKKFKQLGYVKKHNIGIPQQFKEIHLTQRFIICGSLLKLNEIDLFLKQLITGYE